MKKIVLILVSLLMFVFGIMFPHLLEHLDFPLRINISSGITFVIGFGMLAMAGGCVIMDLYRLRNIVVILTFLGFFIVNVALIDKRLDMNERMLSYKCIIL